VRCIVQFGCTGGAFEASRFFSGGGGTLEEVEVVLHLQPSNCHGSCSFT
jgi:hypothetical protein